MEHGGHCSDSEIIEYITKFEFIKRGITPSQLDNIPKKDIEVFSMMFQKHNEIKNKKGNLNG